MNLEKKIKKKYISDTSIKYNEAILYYCFDCDEKLCGKCTSFTNKESKIHESIKFLNIQKFKNQNI